MRRAYVYGANKVTDFSANRVEIYFTGWVSDTDGGSSFEFGNPPDANYSVRFQNDARMSEMRARAINQLSDILAVSRRNITFLEW